MFSPNKGTSPVTLSKTPDSAVFSAFRHNNSETDEVVYDKQRLTALIPIDRSFKT